MTKISAEEKKLFKKSLLSVSLPIVLQQLLNNSLSFTDTLMIGQLGEIKIAAVGLSNQLYFLIFVVIFGIASGASIFTSQYWGIQDRDGIQKTLGVALCAGFIFSFIASFMSIFTPSFLLRFFVSDESVISEGCVYLRTVGISYMFVAVSQIFSVTLRSSGDVMTPMKATLFSMILNVVGNYFLIFTAELGVFGAALATAVSRFVEMAILFAAISRSDALHIRWHRVFSFDRIFATKILRTAFPVILDDGLWALGMTVYKAVFSRMGIGTLAASNICESIQDLFFVVQNALGAAIAVLIGNIIGKGDNDRDKVSSFSLVSLNCVVAAGVVSGAFMVFTRFFIPNLFNVDESVRQIASASIVVISILLPLKFLNHANIVGVLRSGGDTKFLLKTEIFSIWVIGVPSAIISGLVLKLDLCYVYLFVSLEELSKSIILIPRLKSGKWINNLTI